VLWQIHSFKQCAAGVPPVLLNPLAGISYAIYRYVTVVPVDQRLVVISSAGLVLIKTLVIPAIRSALKSKALERLKDFLRGGKDIKKAA
jgi:hypothetical protein